MKNLRTFMSETTVTYDALDRIKRTFDVNRQEYPPEDNEHQFDGGLENVNPADVVSKIIDSDVLFKLKDRYGENWKEIVAGALAVLAHTQPNSHLPGAYESFNPLQKIVAAAAVLPLPAKEKLAHYIENAVDGIEEDSVDGGKTDWSWEGSAIGRGDPVIAHELFKQGRVAFEERVQEHLGENIKNRFSVDADAGNHRSGIEKVRAIAKVAGKHKDIFERQIVPSKTDLFETLKIIGTPILENDAPKIKTLQSFINQTITENHDYDDAIRGHYSEAMAKLGDHTKAIGHIMKNIAGAGIQLSKAAQQAASKRHDPKLAQIENYKASLKESYETGITENIMDFGWEGYEIKRHVETYKKMPSPGLKDHIMKYASNYTNPFTGGQLSDKHLDKLKKKLDDHDSKNRGDDFR